MKLDNLLDLPIQQKMELSEMPASFALSPCGTQIALGFRFQGKVQVFDTASCELFAEWTAIPLSPYPLMNETSIEYKVSALEFSADSRSLLVGGKALKSWDVATQKKIRSFKAFGSSCEYLIKHQSNDYVLAFGNGMNVFDLNTGKKIRRSLSQEGKAVSPDGKFIVGTDANVEEQEQTVIKVWNLHSGDTIRDLDDSYAIRPRSFEFSQNGKLLAGAGYDGIKIWDFETGEQIQRIEKYKNVKFHQHLDQVRSCFFSSDSKSVLSLGSDGKIQAWDLESGKNSGTLLSSQALVAWSMNRTRDIIVALCREDVQSSVEIHLWMT